MKHCFDCGETKPIDAFNRNRASSTGRMGCCAECQKRRGRDYHLRKTYGLTVSDVQALIQAQLGVCAICATNPAEHVDHDHLSGKIRGVLCFTCNVALGQLKDDVTLFRKAIDYLERTTWQRTLVAPGVYQLTSPRPAAAASPTS